MKDRPILFSAPMVHAILSGAKTQTRRIVKPNAWVEDHGENAAGECIKAGGYIELSRCPYGWKGDRLWVRETFAIASVYQMGGKQIAVYPVCDSTTDYGGPWTPSIYMPRWASRITLEITGVRIERLQEISESDACAEGVSNTGPYPNAVLSGFLPRPADIARREFKILWESINGPASWDANPWVWVVEFRRVKP